MRLHGMTVLNQTVFAKEDKLKDKMQERKIETMLSIGVSFRLLQTTYSHVIGVCKHFCAAQSWHMPFRLLKDAWLACSRCSFSVLPTPFWSPIRHLLRTTWQPIDLLLITNLFFARVFYICSWFIRNYVMTFQNLICISYVLRWKGLCIGGWWQNRQLTVLVMFLLNEPFRFFR